VGERPLPHGADSGPSRQPPGGWAALSHPRLRAALPLVGERLSVEQADVASSPATLAEGLCAAQAGPGSVFLVGREVCWENHPATLTGDGSEVPLCCHRCAFHRLVRRAGRALGASVTPRRGACVGSILRPPVPAFLRAQPNGQRIAFEQSTGGSSQVRRRGGLTVERQAKSLSTAGTSVIHNSSPGYPQGSLTT